MSTTIQLSWLCGQVQESWCECTVGLTFFEEFVSRRVGVDIAHTPHRFSDISQSDRYVAGVVETRTGTSVEKLLICCVYADASNTRLASDLVTELVVAMNQYRCAWVLIGDFNLEQTDPVLAELEATGQCSPLDMHFGPLELLPHTSPNRVRRIDFGVSSRNFVPSGLFHFPGIGDHLGVAYTVAGDTQIKGHRLPARSPLLHTSTSQVENNFHNIWNDNLFLSALAEHDLNEAWTLLSRAAEQA